MSSNNAAAKSLLLEAQIIVTNKFTVFSGDQAVDKTRLDALRKKVNDEIERFKKPEVWLLPLQLDRPKVFASLLAIHGISVPKIGDLETQVDTLIGMLNEALDKASENDTSAMTESPDGPNRNPEALAALQNIRRKVLGRTQFFMARDIDLAANEDYQALRSKQLPLMQSYTEKLRDNSIIETEITVIILNGCADTIQASTDLPTFLSSYGKVGEFIEGRLPPAQA